MLSCRGGIHIKSPICDFKYFSSLCRNISANFLHLSKFVTSLVIASLHQFQVNFLSGNKVNRECDNPSKDPSRFEELGSRAGSIFLLWGKRFWFLLFLRKMSPTGSQQSFFLTAHYGSVIWPPEDFCVPWASWLLALGKKLFHVIVTQLIIGLGPYFTVCQAGRLWKHQ